MERLIDELLKLGATRVTLEAKVFGGGQVIAGMNSLERRRAQHPLRARLPAQRAHPGGRQGRARRLLRARCASCRPAARPWSSGSRSRHGRAAASHRPVLTPTTTQRRKRRWLPKTRVLVVDDSALVRSLLGEIINRQADMVCVGAAADPLVAREMIRELNPDVITLDVEMPRMDGIEFLSRLMRLRPMPVVMVSTLTERGADGHAARAGAGRGGLRRQAEDRRQRRPGAAGRRHHRQDPHRRAARTLRRAVAPAASAAASRRIGRSRAAGPAVDREDHLHRRLHRRHRGHQGGAGAAAGRRAGGADHPAHAAGLHAQLRDPARRPVPHRASRRPATASACCPAMPTSRRAACT